jgi:hypothetical protein
MNNNKTTNILLGILIAVLIAIGIIITIKQNRNMKDINPETDLKVILDNNTSVPAENKSQSSTQAAENKTVKKDMVCEAFQLESETCFLPTGQKLHLNMGDAVYDEGKYYAFYRNNETTESVNIYKDSTFSCSNLNRVVACEPTTKVVLLKNDTESVKTYESIIKNLGDAEYQKNGGHQY